MGELFAIGAVVGVIGVCVFCAWAVGANCCRKLCTFSAAVGLTIVLMSLESLLINIERVLPANGETGITTCGEGAGSSAAFAAASLAVSSNEGPPVVCSLVKVFTVDSRRFRSENLCWVGVPGDPFIGQKVKTNEEGYREDFTTTSLSFPSQKKNLDVAGPAAALGWCGQCDSQPHHRTPHCGTHCPNRTHNTRPHQPAHHWGPYLQPNHQLGGYRRGRDRAQLDLWPDQYALQDV